jgi:mannosyltransferase
MLNLRTHRSHWLCLAGVLLLALVPRLYGLSERSLWFDEGFTWRLVQFPFSEMLERATRDNSPPFYYMVLQAWQEVFGASAVALRSLSVFFGLATIWGTYLFAAAAFGGVLSGSEPAEDERSRGRAIGLFAALLVALSAYHIRYSWELRMYALAAALAAFSSWALVRALHPRAGFRRWWLYGVLALLLVYTHYYGLFTLAAQGIFALFFLWQRAGWRLPGLLRQDTFRRAALTACLVALAWSPWFPVFLRQKAQVKADFWSRPVDFWQLAELAYRMFLSPEHFPGSRQTMLWSFDICVVLLYLLARKGRAAEWLTLALALGPFAFSVLVSQYDVSPGTLRYFLMAHVFLLVGLAALVWKIPFRLERGVVACLVLAIFVEGDVDFQRTMNLNESPGSRGAAEFLAASRQQAEPVVAAWPSAFLPLLHYASDRDGYYLYTNGRPLPHYWGTAALRPEEMISENALKTLQCRRLWVVNITRSAWGDRTVEIPAPWAEKDRRVFREVLGIGEVVVCEYVIP